MSKFLKFIVHLVILLAILDVLALAVPPFLGINTAIIDGKEASTNLPVGSVTYAKPVSVNELQVGDSVLVQEGDSVFRYKINSIDTSNGVFHVYDQTDVDAGEKAITLKNVAPRVVITLGYVGYLIIATQSIEGMIIIGLVVLFLIILFILAELWRKDKTEQSLGEYEEEEDPVPEAAAGRGAGSPAKTERQRRKEMKKEYKRRAKEEAKLDKERARMEYEEATRKLKEEAKQKKKDAKQKRKEARKRARTGGFVEDLDPIEAKMEAAAHSRESVAADEANELLKQSVAAATVEMGAEVEAEDLGATRDVVIPKEILEEPQEETEPEVTVEAEPSAKAAEEEPEEVPPSVEEVYEEPEIPKVQKMAIPVYTQEQLLARAQAAGEAPEVIRDEKTGVTFLDYSSIIIEETEKLMEDDKK